LAYPILPKSTASRESSGENFKAALYGKLAQGTPYILKAFGRRLCLNVSFGPGQIAPKRSDGLTSATKGASIVDNSSLALSPRYNDFLFAPICKEANGMHLSVLSALARLNLDPWEEATHLAAMPKADARRALVSTLDLVSGRSWSPSEAEKTAERLVRLLPEQRGDATPAAKDITGVLAQRTNYWLVLMFIAMAISFLWPHHQTPTADAGISTSGAISQSKSGNENITSPVSGDQGAQPR
jgi:hypothetical protein